MAAPLVCPTCAAEHGDGERFCARCGQDFSGGVMWYQDGPSGSPAAAQDIIAIAHRRDSGAGPTRQMPS